MNSINIYECKPHGKHSARSLSESGRYSQCPPGAYGQSVQNRHIDQLASGMQGWEDVLTLRAELPQAWGRSAWIHGRGVWVGYLSSLWRVLEILQCIYMFSELLVLIQSSELYPILIWLLVSISVFEYYFPLQARSFAPESLHWGGKVTWFKSHLISVGSRQRLESRV